MIAALEYMAVALNIVYVIGAARGKMWCWPAGIAGSALSIWLFVEIKLYAEALLFIYYVWMGIYGWLQWRKSGVDQGTVAVLTWPVRSHGMAIALTYIFYILLYQFLARYTDAQMPLIDAYTTSFSFTATYLVARRVLENWIYWIIIDAVSIYLYLSRGLEVYAALSAIYTAMAVYGYMSWRTKFIRSYASSENSHHRS